MSPISAEMESAITRRVGRDREPLRWRRVRHLESGREGYIERAWGETHGYFNGKTFPPYAEVVWDDAPKQYGGWRRPERVPLSDIEVLEAPAIPTTVRVRKVLFRGHKEQVAERMAQFGPAPEGTERYVEFDPQPMAYRRWRIVQVGPPLNPAAVAEIPDQAPQATRLRRLAKDAAEYD